MSDRSRRKVLILVTMLLGCSGLLFADAGVPMLMLAWPGMIILLLPVIVIEVVVSRKILKRPIGNTIAYTSVSNVASTVVGIPLTWLLLVVVQVTTGGGGGGYGISTPMGRVLSVTWQAAWLLPIDSDLYWMVPTAMLVLFIPFFFASWWSEYWVCRLMLRKSEIDKRVLRKSVFWSNVFSYGLLIVADIGHFAFSVATHKNSLD